MRAVLAVSILCLCGVALAQSSPSYRLEESTLNAGGHPRGGLGLTSASFLVSLDAVGEAPIAPMLGSAGYSMDVGFARCFPPPREVRQLAISGNKATLVWAPERSVGMYRVYRGDLTGLPVDYGACPIASVGIESVPLHGTPDVGQPFFYLVTAENALLEEGIRGYDSAGASRVNLASCP